MSSAPLVLPGDALNPSSSSSLPGHGVHLTAPSTLTASIAGTTLHTPNSQPNTLSRLSIARPAFAAQRSVLPEVESVVLGRVTRVGVRQAVIEILVVGETVCREGFQGIVRREDVRATEKDRLVVADSLRVGDVLRGVVISLGDQSSYYISTASNELGVIMATSEAGNQMYPISWKEFKDPKTGAVESRKVAKPF